MKLVIRYPTGAHKVQAEAAWKAFTDAQKDLPVTFSVVEFTQALRPLTDATAECEISFPEGLEPGGFLTLSEPFLALPPIQQRLTLLHETIHLSYMDSGCKERQKRAEELMEPHKSLKGSSPAERRFETQRLGLARRIYGFPEEVIAEKHLRLHYPDLAKERLAQYTLMHQETSQDIEKAELGLEWGAGLYFGLNAELGATLASDDNTLRSQFQERAKELDARVRQLVGDERDAQLSRLRSNLLTITLNPLNWDETAAQELFELVVSTPFPGR
jgi:hypothetical protein